MALRNIVQDGDPILKKKCREVVDFDARLAQLLDDMGETMINADGLGLAGPQVGILRRCFVVLDIWEDAEGVEHQDVIEFVNPEIVLTSGKSKIFEGCLSFPGRNGAIERPTMVKVRAQDRNGEWFEMTAYDILARAICHENDHLDGITILDKTNTFYEDLTPAQVKALMLDEEYD